MPQWSNFAPTLREPDPAPAPSPTVLGIAKNIVTDYGAVPNSGDDGPAFVAFRTFAQAQTRPIVLTIPPGVYDQYPTLGRAFDGIKDLTIEAAGAVLDYIWLGGIGQPESPDFSARVATVALGATTVSLLTPSQASRFAVGQWVLLTALDLQGFGLPSNQYYFEYNKIAAINAVTGEIALQTPTVNAYKPTYPLYSAGPSMDFGGPATLYAMQSDWDASLVINDLTIRQDEVGGVYGQVRNVELNNVSFDGFWSPAPSMAQRYRMVRCTSDTGKGNIEVDKMVYHLEFIECTFPDLPFFQSCMHEVVVSGGTLGSLFGTPKRLTVSGATIGGLGIGTLTYGVTERVAIQDSIISGGGITHFINSRRQALSDFSYSSGVFSISKATGPVPWAVPGAVMIYCDDGGRSNYGNAFRVLDVTEDGVNTLIHTDAPPTLPIIGDGVFSTNSHVTPHPCPDLTVINCTGSPSIVDHSTYGVAHRPVFEHILRTLTGNFGDQARIPCWGTLVALRVNVLQAYTGAHAELTVNVGGVAQALAIHPTTLAIVLWKPIINLRIAGERIIAPTLTTGAQAGDSIAAPGAIWVMDGIAPSLSADTGGDPPGQQAIIEIELTTNQGL